MLPLARLEGRSQRAGAPASASVPGVGILDSRAWVCSMGRAACSSGSEKSPCAARCRVSSSASLISLVKAILAPIQVGTVPLLLRVERFT